MNRLENFLLMASIQAMLFSVALLVLVMVVKTLFRQRANQLIISGFVVMIALWFFAMAPLPNWSTAWLNSSQSDNAPEPAVVSTNSTAANQPVTDQPVTNSIEMTPNSTTNSNQLSNSNPPIPSNQSGNPNLGQWLSAAVQNFEELAVTPPVAASRWSNWKSWFTLFVVAGMLIGSLRLLFALLGIRKLNKSGKKVTDARLHEALDIVRAKLGFNRSLEIRETDETTAAFTVGWRKPILFVSSNWRTWDKNQITATLAHEIAHISNGDYFQRIVAQISTVLNFYNPIVHMLCAQLNLEQELSADDRAASVVGGRQSYLGVLAEMALKTEYPQGRLSPMFLPTRKTFFRRIEMLRKTTSRSGATWEPRKRNWASVLSVGMMCLIGVGIAGLRLPTARAVVQDVIEFEKRVSSPVTNPATEANLRFAPADAEFVLVFRTNRIMENKIVKAVFGELESGDFVDPDPNLLMSQTGMTNKELDQITAAGSIAGPGEGYVVIAQSVEDGWWSTDDQAKELEDRFGASLVDSFRGHEIFKGTVPHRNSESYWCAADAKTLLWATDLKKLKACLREPEGPRRSWAEHWKTHSKELLSFYFGPEAIEILNEGPEGGNRLIDVISPFWEHTNFAVGGVTFGNENRINVLASCGTEDGANEVGDTIKGLVPLTKNFVRGSKQMEEMSKELTAMLLELLESTKVETDENLVSASMNLESDPMHLVKTLTPMVMTTRAAAKRTNSRNNIRQLALGLHNYASAYDHLPPSVLISPEGKTYSWRIAILPFIEQHALYEAYRFDEEWNSPHNAEITANAPSLFRHSNSTSLTNSCYFVVNGDKTMFPLDKTIDSGLNIAEAPIGFGSITDGTPNTLMLVESKQDIHWAEPRDLKFEDANLLDSLGGFDNDGFAVAFGDCSVRNLSASIGKKLLKELLTRAGGEIIDQEELLRNKK